MFLLVLFSNPHAEWMAFPRRVVFAYSIKTRQLKSKKQKVNKAKGNILTNQIAS